MVTAHAREHDLGPRDNAEAFVTLDGCQIAVCARCDRVLYECSCCEFCAQPRCVCEPISMREFRALAAKHDLGPARVRPR